MDGPTAEDVKAFLWKEGDLRWKLHTNQLIILNAIESLSPRVKEAVILCSRRFGKSFLGCILGLQRCLQSDRRRLIRIIGPDIKQTEMIVDYNMAKITEELYRLGLRHLVERVKSEKMYKVGGSGIFLGGFDSQEDSLRGGEADEILIEETGSADPEQYNYQMKSVLKPQLLKTRGRMVHLTTLPKLPDHPFIVDTIPQARLDNSFYSYSIYDDPLATEEIVEDAIKDCGGVHSIEFRREYLNEIIRDPHMMIVPDFRKELHVKPVTLPEHARYQTVIDFGGVRDKTVAILQCYDFRRAKLLVVGERAFDTNVPTSVIVRGVLELEAGLPEPPLRWADCPGQLQVDLNDAHDFQVKLPLKDDWEAAINSMQLMFTWNDIEIDPSCQLLIATLESGQFNKNRTDFSRTTALGHCDAIAALMYGCRMMNKLNPYPALIPNRDTVFSRPPPDPDIVQVAKSIQPKSFRNNFSSDTYKVKKFGSFKN